MSVLPQHFADLHGSRAVIERIGEAERTLSAAFGEMNDDARMARMHAV